MAGPSRCVESVFAACRRQRLRIPRRYLSHRFETLRIIQFERYASSIGGLPLPDQFTPQADEDEAHEKAAHPTYASLSRTTGYKVFEIAATTTATLLVLGVRTRLNYVNKY